MIQTIKNNAGKIAVAVSLTTGGYYANDQYGERKYVGWDKDLVVQEVVTQSKNSFQSMGFQKPGIQYEEIVYFYPMTYEPSLMQKALTAVVGFIKDVSEMMISCDTGRPPPPPTPPETGPVPSPPTDGDDEVDWYYTHTHFDQANLITNASEDVIGIVDTGVDLGHPDLQGVIKSYANYSGEGAISDVTDRIGHGTWIAGAIAAKNRNGGMRGMTQAKLSVCKALSADGGTQIALVNCLDYVWKIGGAKRVNNSWGGGGRSLLIEQKLAQMSAAGIRNHIAAGNDGSVVSNPAAYVPTLNAMYPGTAFAVCATDSLDRKASFSNYGPEITLCAPGVQMKSTCPLMGSQMGTNYCWASGTSMATPVSVAVGSLANSVQKTIKTYGPLKIVDAVESVK
jgi:subtilisin family serine protease